MNEVKKAGLTLVEPSNFPNPVHRAIRDALSEVDIESGDQDWFLRILMLPDCLGQPLSEYQLVDDAESIFEDSELLRIVKNLPGRSTKLLILASKLAGFGPRYGKTAANHNWFEDFGRLGNLDAREVVWDSISELNLQEGFYGTLVPNVIPLRQIIQLDQIGTGSEEFDDTRPTNLEFWLQKWYSKTGPSLNFDWIVERLHSLPNGKFVQGVLDVIGKIDTVLGVHSFGSDWQLFSEELLKLQRILDSRAPEASQDGLLVKAWWQASSLTYCAHLGGIKPNSDQIDRLVSSAKLHLGKMRAELKNCPDDCDFDHYKWAISLMKAFASPWQVVHALLLVFAEMTTQAVSTDLRYWGETDKSYPPSPFMLVPTWIATSLYSQELKAEMDRDPTLASFRSEFSKFCLSRLRTRKSETKDNAEGSNWCNENFVEPRPWWRLCYVKAIRELGVNPAGKAHKTLFWLSKNDPDDDVKEAAKSAYNTIRHKGGKDAMSQSGVSPRRPLFAAFWWLRQAHLLNLGIQVDAIGADRTRDKEIRRTRES